MNPARTRWYQAACGFGGLGGLRWVSSVLSARPHHVPECYGPTDIASPDTQYLTIKGEPVAFRELGRGGPTIVLLHGFAMRLQSWDVVQPALAQRYRTVALDLWGYGASGRPARAHPEDWMEEVAGVLDALAIREAVLVGHSLGGRVALMCARAMPERVLGLTLCDADFGHVPFGYLLVWLLCHGGLIPDILRRLRGDREALRRLMQMVTTPGFHLTEETLTLHHEPLLVRGTTECWTSLGHHPWVPAARRLPGQIRCPVGLLWGAEDPVIPREWGRLLAERLGGAELATVRDCGHFPPEEHPGQVTEAVERLVQRL
jgi:pimeloyl-ACP methyl ester carboxylesterase